MSPSLSWQTFTPLSLFNDFRFSLHHRWSSQWNGSCIVWVSFLRKGNGSHTLCHDGPLRYFPHSTSLGFLSLIAGRLIGMGLTQVSLLFRINVRVKIFLVTFEDSRCLNIMQVNTMSCTLKSRSSLISLLPVWGSCTMSSTSRLQVSSLDICDVCSNSWFISTPDNTKKLDLWWSFIVSLIFLDKFLSQRQ